MSPLPPLCGVPEIVGWAALATQGQPHPFLYIPRDYRHQVQEEIGDAWRRENETKQQGWRRAYRAGWRCIKVKVTPL